MPLDPESNGTRESARESLADVIEVRLPPISDYLTVLRATVGVLAGNMSFNYDEIIQLRVAVSEAFNLAIRRTTQVGPASTPRELGVRFIVETDRIEILVANPGDVSGPPMVEEDIESQALLESLMDEVEVGEGATDKPLIRMAKYITASEG